MALKGSRGYEVLTNGEGLGFSNGDLGSTIRLLEDVLSGLVDPRCCVLPDGSRP